MFYNAITPRTGESLNAQKAPKRAEQRQQGAEGAAQEAERRHDGAERRLAMVRGAGCWRSSSAPARKCDLYGELEGEHASFWDGIVF